MVRPFAAALLLLAATIASGQPHLVFDHNVGDDWPLDARQWMSFVAISSDGQMVAADSLVSFGEGKLGFWSFPDGKLSRTIDGSPVAISPDFRFLALQRQILNLRSGKPVLTVADKEDTLMAAAFSADSELIAVRASPHIVKGAQLAVMRTADGSVVSSFGTRFICTMAFTPDARTLATGHWNNITLWDVRSGAKLAVLMSPPRKPDPERALRDGRYLDAVAVSPDGKLIAAGSDDGELQVWNFVTRKLMYATSLSWASVTAVAFSPDSKLIATGSYHDGTLRLVDSTTGTLLSEVQVSMFGVGALGFSPDGKYLVTPSNSGMLNIGKLTRGGAIRVFRVEN